MGSKEIEVSVSRCKDGFYSFRGDRWFNKSAFEKAHLCWSSPPFMTLRFGKAGHCYLYPPLPPPHAFPVAQGA